MLKSIDKSHSKNDLVDLINCINVPIVFSHTHNKKDIQDLLVNLFKEKKDLTFEKNVYNINTINELQIYVSNRNPKKTLTVKEKSNVMRICREISKFCKNKYIVEKTNYKDIIELHDDMRWIIQYGDLPSVRRTCKLMNKNVERVQEWIPIISPQVKKVLEEQDKTKKIRPYGLQKSYGPFILKFD